MKNKALLLKIFGGLMLVAVTGFLLIQLIPVDRTNPPVISEPLWDSPETRELMAAACFDCHSNEVKYPWYSRIAPASWLVAYDVREGREHLNFSEWPVFSDEGGESIEVLLSGEMPPKAYTLMHPEARFTQAEVEQLVAGLQATFQNHPPSESQEETARQRLEDSQDDDDDDNDDDYDDYDDDDDDDDDDD